MDAGPGTVHRILPLSLISVGCFGQTEFHVNNVGMRQIAVMEGDG